ncbi:MAG: C25 family cysteine peptidase, partial [Thermoplasmata archaeon]
LVGGSYAIPDYYFDYHINYYYWSAKIDYIGSTAPYGNLTYNLTYETYPREDLGVGRIIGHSLMDTSILLMRTIFYREFLSGGIYADLTPTSWEKNSCVIEGHRLNQPNFGGPPAFNDEPYLPAGEVDDVFSEAGFNETYYVPRNFTISNDTNMPIGEILDQAFSSSSMILINAHGGLPGEQALLEIGIDSIIGREYLFTLDEKEAVKRPLVPSVVYVIACETGTAAVDLPMEDYISLGFVHSGSVAYIAPDTYQTICFWDKAPKGPEADQAIYFFQRLLGENIPIGKALSAAKWESNRHWKNDTSYEDDVAGVTLHLFGDPAFEPSKPNVPFVDKKQFDVKATYDGTIDAGTSFYVSASITDLYSGLTINDAVVTITFWHNSRSGYTTTFTAPNEKGVYYIVITISKEGYHDISAKYVVYVPNSKEDFIPLILSGAGITTLIVFVAIYLRKRSHISKFRSKSRKK